MQAFAKFLKDQRRLRESIPIQRESDLTHLDTIGAGPIGPGETTPSFKTQCRLVFWDFVSQSRFRRRSGPCFALPPGKGRKGVTMDFAIILIVSNTLLAGFIYFVVTRIWQD
jgi:hypothetical protein